MKKISYIKLTNITIERKLQIKKEYRIGDDKQCQN